MADEAIAAKKMRLSQHACWTASFVIRFNDYFFSFSKSRISVSNS